MYDGRQAIEEGRAHQESARAGHEPGPAGRARDTTEKARQTADRATGKAREMAEKQRTSLVNRASHVASAIRVAADNLADENEDRLSEYARHAADQVDRLADYVERRDTGSLIGDLRRMARRNPAVFLGGGLVAGLMLGRFLHSDPSDDYDRYGERAPIGSGRGWE